MNFLVSLEWTFFQLLSKLEDSLSESQRKKWKKEGRVYAYLTASEEFFSRTLNPFFAL